MDFISEDIDTYCKTHSTPELEVLKMLNRETCSKFLYPRMLSGHMQGLFLSMISSMIKPTKILEIGTFTGYSAICLAQGLKENGTLFTIEKNIELEDIILKYINLAHLQKKVKLHIGNAIEIIPTLNHTFDLVFIDADKENYKNYFDMIIDKVVPGGYIIADNVLWSGKVINPKSNDVEANAIADFNNYIQSNLKIDNIILPYRDGLSIMIKKK